MYDYGAAGVLYASLHIAVLAGVRYWLYRDRLRVPIQWMYPIIAAVAMLGGGLWVHTGGVPGMAFDTYRVLLALFMYAISCCIIKAPIAEHSFSYAFILAFNASVETTAFYVQLNFVPNAPVYAYPAISSMIVAAAFVPGVKCLQSMITRLSEMGSDRVWGWLDLACYSFLFMNLMVTPPHPAHMRLAYPVGRCLMLLGMAGVYKAAVRMMDAMRVAADAKAALSLTQRRVLMQQSYYDRMVSQMDEVRRMRHDQRHHKAALAALIRAGDTAALSAYIEDMAEPEESLPLSGNLAADSLLLYYMDAAKRMGAPMETRLAIGGGLPVSDPDLCVILGNLLENAVDAQAYLSEKDRHIRVTAKGDAHSLTLAVDNRFDGALLVENGAYRSRKAGEGHGVGLVSVRAVCEKYGGILQLETEGDMFMAGVVIGV